MNISIKFLKRYLDLPADLTYDQLSYDLTMRTVEVEDVIDAAAKFHDIVVGEIKEVKADPNAAALKVCMVDVGENELKQIVCGGINLTAGHKVCVAKPGSEVVWHGEGEPVKLKETKLRGVSSYGMICGSTEVYLADFYPPQDEREIVDFTDLGIECEAGQNVVFDVDVKGGVNIKKFYGDEALSLFIQPPSVEELRHRLEGRGTDTAEAIEQRLAKAEYEMTFAPQFDHVIVNDNLETAKQETLQVVKAFLG